MRLLSVVTVLAAATATAAMAGPSKGGCDAGCEWSAVRKYRPAMHYYEPYPWWWIPPHVERVRTNYVKWHRTYSERPYNRPHPNGVVGYTVIGPLYWW
jgi:hypothetical protein